MPTRIAIPRTPSDVLRSTKSEPLVNYTAYKLRRTTVERLEKAARARGWSTAALVRFVLDGWVGRQGGQGNGKR
jgi:hypothetical protein